MKTTAFALAAIIGLCVMGVLMRQSRNGSRRAAGQSLPSRPRQVAETSVSTSAFPAAPLEKPPGAPPNVVVSNEVVKAPVTSNAPPAITAKAKKPQDPLADPDARSALALVGTDPDAEVYWFGAINDPSLSAHERQDLIEDLNEEGLSDPKNPTIDDLPLIIRRLELIEALAPFAMDEVNMDAFEEAFKDLRNLADQALGVR
jgi:hypothetical protein